MPAFLEACGRHGRRQDQDGAKWCLTWRVEQVMQQVMSSPGKVKQNENILIE